MPLSETGAGVLAMVNGGLCDPDLRVLNQAIVDRIKALRAQANRVAVRDLRVGDQVELTGFTGSFEYANGTLFDMVDELRFHRLEIRNATGSS